MVVASPSWFRDQARFSNAKNYNNSVVLPWILEILFFVIYTIQRSMIYLIYLVIIKSLPVYDSVTITTVTAIKITFF